MKSLECRRHRVMIRARKSVTAMGSSIEQVMITGMTMVVSPPGGGWPVVAIAETAVQKLLRGDSDSPSDNDREKDLSWTFRPGSNLYEGPGIDGSTSYLQAEPSSPPRTQDRAELSVASVSVTAISSTNDQE